jgi:ubiquinone/menaquinone biosynthesis C-methylase UbiE
MSKILTTVSLPSIFYSLLSPYYKRYINSLDLKGNEKLLDFGSGLGIESTYLAEVLHRGNGRLTCLDISEPRIKAAQKRLKKYPNIDFKIGDITGLSLEDSSYDAVFIHFVLHHIKRDTRQETVKALAHLLKAGGKIFIREPLIMKHGMSADEIRDLMAQSGFQEVDYKTARLLAFGKIYTGVFEKRYFSFGSKDLLTSVLKK